MRLESPLRFFHDKVTVQTPGNSRIRMGCLEAHFDVTSRIPFVYGDDQITSDKIPCVEEIASLQL